jgi:hypothetical protein
MFGWVFLSYGDINGRLSTGPATTGGYLKVGFPAFPGADGPSLAWVGDGRGTEEGPPNTAGIGGIKNYEPWAIG